MIADALLQVSSAQQVTADAVSEDYYDAGDVTPKRDLGAGRPVALVACITAVGTTTGDIKIQAIQSATAGLGSGTQVLGQVNAAATDLVAGACFVVTLSTGIPPLRYYGANYDVTGTVDCTFDTWIIPRNMAAGLAQFFARGYTFDIS
jgi:hypothetical protein